MAAHTQSPAIGDLLIDIRPLGYVDWRGTRKQLEAEGIVPSNIVWPDSAKAVSWEAGNMTFTLRRCRPFGVKLSPRQWSQRDSWFLRQQHTSTKGDGFAAARLFEKRQAYEDELEKLSPSYRRMVRRFQMAQLDEIFQRFMSSFSPTSYYGTRRG